MYGARRAHDDPRNKPREPEASPNQANLIRKLHVNFDELYVAAVDNRIVIYESKQLTPIDVLADHEETIRGLDVAQMLRNIVSFSRNEMHDKTTFMVHCLVDSDHVRCQEEPHQAVFRPKTLQDQSVYAGQLKWKLTYKVEMSAHRVPKCLGISQIGDFCVMGGDQFVALWTIDALMDSYSQWAIYAEKALKENKQEFVEEVESLPGEVVQAQVCDSGRLFVTLEKDAHSLRVWHNDDISLEQATGEVDFRRFLCEPGLVEPYSLPRHRYPIERFKFIAQVANQRQVQPCVLLTITRRKAFIWVESLELAEMAFRSVHSFDIYYDAIFIDRQQVTPRCDFKPLNLSHDCSKLFHSFKDLEKHSKKQIQQDNAFGMVPSAFGGTAQQSSSIDWLLLLMQDHLVLTECTGLRNVLPQQLEFLPKHKILFDNEVAKSITLTRILSSTTLRAGKFTDDFNLIMMNDSLTNVVKKTVKLDASDMSVGTSAAAAKTPQRAELTSTLRVNLGSKQQVSQMLAHGSLPLVALVLADEVQVYRLEDQVHPAVHEGCFQLHGSYATGINTALLDCQWINDLDQLLILVQKADEKPRVELISATATMKMVSLFGNRASLQEEVSKSQKKLAAYQKVATIEDTLDENVKSIVLINTEVKPQDQPHTYPSEKICFAAIGVSGKSVISQVEFQVDMDFKVCEMSQVTLHRKVSFQDGFTLTRTVASVSCGSGKTFALLLAQKDPDVSKTQANRRGPTARPKVQLELVSICKDAGFKTKFVAPGNFQDLLEKPIVAKFSSQMLAIQVFQGAYRQEEQFLYLYNLESESYSGYLNVTKMIGIEPGLQTADFIFLKEKIKGAIALTIADRIYVLYQKQQSWDVLLKSDKLTNKASQETVKLVAVTTPDQKRQMIVSLHENGTLLAHKETKLLQQDSEKRLALPQSSELHRMIIERQRSQGLFHPNLLAELYFKGYGSFVVKILLKLKELLESRQTEKLSDYLDMDLETLLLELKTQAELLMAGSSAGAPPEPEKPKKQTAFSVFDDLDESESDEEKPEEVKQEEKGVDDPNKLFKEGAELLAALLTQKEAFESLGLDARQAKQLVIFVHKFKNIFELDFYVDPLASMLLRKVFFETEKVDEAVLQQAQTELNKNEEAALRESKVVANLNEEDEFMNYKVEEVKPFSMEEYMAVHYQETQVKSTGDLDLISDWTSAMVCQALHSENQEVIMNFLAERFNFEKNLTWAMMRKLGIPIWLKDISQLKKYIDFVAKTEYRVNEGRAAMCKADYAAIWYTLLGRKSVLSGLYQRENGQERFAQFFQKDFSVEKTRTVAHKNGMALVAKQKHHLACSFLLLGEKIDSAVKVALDYLHDPVLALLMCRIMDPEGKSGCSDSLLNEWFIKRGERFNDPFLINTGHWLKKDFVKSVNELAPDHEESGLDYFYKNNVTEFDLQEKVEIDAAPAAENDIDSRKIYPLITKRNYVILDLLKRLRKAPDVKRALNKAWANAKAPGKSGGGAGSIFDDFLGGDSDSSSEEEEEKKEEIQVDDSQILSQAIKQTLVQRQTVLGLLLIEENRDAVKDVSKVQIDRLTQTVLLDLVVNIVESDSSGEAVKLIKKGMRLLSEFQSQGGSNGIGAKINDSKENTITKENEQFLMTQLQLFGLLKFRIDFLVESGHSRERLSQIGTRVIEEQTSQLLCFVQQLATCGGMSLTATDYNSGTSEALLTLVDHIEVILNCMMILDYPHPDSAGGQSASRSLLKNQKTGSGQPAAAAEVDRSKTLGLSPEKRKFNGLGYAQTMVQGDTGVADEDSDEEEAKQEVSHILTRSSQLLQEPQSPSPQSNKEDFDGDEQSAVEQEKIDLANTVASKFRTDLTLLLSLQTLALLLSKFNLAKKLGQELKMLLGISLYADKLDSMALSLEQLESLKTTIQLNQVKEHLIKIKGTLKSNIAFAKQQDIAGDKGPQRRKPTQNVHKEWQSVYDFIGIWFTNMIVTKTAALFEMKRLHTVKLLQTTLLKREESTDVCLLQRLFLGSKRQAVAKTALESVTQLDSQLKDTLTYVFSRILKPVNQRLVICELHQIIEERYRSVDGKSLYLSYFFSSKDKLKYFAAEYDLHERHKLLEDLSLGLTSQRFALKSNMPEEPEISTQNNLFCTGVELFKHRDPVSDFCFDQCGGGDMMAMAVQAKGMREISVIDTLVYRNRREGGLEMIDEDQMSWSECLHRYAPIQQVVNDLKPTTDAVRAALYSLYTHTTVSETVKTYRPSSALMLDQEVRPPKVWGEELSANYLKTYSDLRITHDDYTNAMDSHPFLPIYLSGNAKGLICMWNFSQMADKSLSQWMLDKDTPPTQANPKKATVKRIEFNSYGDKFAALNMGGSLFLMNFNLETSSKVDPLFSTLYSSKLSDVRLNDFAFLDRDSILAGVSLKEKVLNVYDALLPPRQALVQSHKSGAGGNLMQVLSDSHRVLCFNAKPGYVAEYDLRKEGECLTTKVLCKEEVTAVSLSPDQKQLVLGQSDGVVKIFEISDKNQLAEKGAINAFGNVNGRKGGVSRVRFHPQNGALFASSNVGCVKLLRLAI